ncbi:MAG: serine/threonine protein kinase, partial [Acidobacteria bacterium]|nr:serine/threonine protein kinase [Acidobacteriota bacterium]
RRLRSDAVLVLMLQESLEPLDLSPDGGILGLLPPGDRDWVTTNDIALAASLKQRDGAIVALVMCGPKRTGFPFDGRDRWLVQTLSTAAAVAWQAAGAGEESRDARRPYLQSSPVSEAAFECPRCGVIAASQPLNCGCGAEAILASLPHHLGDAFLVDRRIGGGGMGVVYLARDLRLNREVALKTLPSVGADAIARLREEARAMAALNHESLATIYGLEVWRQTPVLVVEYFPEGTLARRIEQGPCSTAMTVELGLRLARALTYMHAEGRLHRDLTPSNIAFTATRTAKLLDFGLATLMGPEAASGGRTTTGGQRPRAQLTGTFGYLPPEAFEGSRPSPAFDLWGLSVVMLEMTAGRRLFHAEHRDGIRHPQGTPDVSEACAALRTTTPGLKALLTRALAQRPELRFRTGGELQAALESLGRR